MCTSRFVVQTVCLAIVAVECHLYIFYVNILCVQCSTDHSVFTTACSARQKGRGQQAAIRDVVCGCLKSELSLVAAVHEGYLALDFPKGGGDPPPPLENPLQSD